MKKLQEKTPINIQNAINNYVAEIKSASDEKYAKWLKNSEPSDFILEINTKYYKVVEYSPQGCVFCFIDSGGNIFKPAGWNAPAKGVRGHVLNKYLPLTCGSLYRK